MNEYKAEGRGSMHQRLGTICVHLADKKVNLSVGQVLVMDRGVLHDVEAVEESAFLLTIAWPKGGIRILMPIVPGLDL